MKPTKIDDIKTMAKFVQEIHDTYGVSIEYTEKKFENEVELVVGTENWEYELATYKGNSLCECIKLLKLELNHNATSNSNLIRYLQKLPVFGELKDLFSSSAISYKDYFKCRFPENLMDMSLMEHAKVIEKTYEPNLLVEFLIRIATEISNSK